MRFRRGATPEPTPPPPEPVAEQKEPLVEATPIPFPEEAVVEVKAGEPVAETPVNKYEALFKKLWK